MDNNIQMVPKTFLRSVNILFMALVAGQVMFALVAIFVVRMKQTVAGFDRQFIDVALWLIPAIAVAGIAIGWLFFNARLKAVRAKGTLAEKLGGYQPAMIARLAIMEGPSLLALAVFLLSGEYIFLGTSAFVILAFLFNRPTKNRIVQQLQLHDDEKWQMEDDGL